jgi:ABC-type multidrug transport system fused ATPase/permease subunit
MKFLILIGQIPFLRLCKFMESVYGLLKSLFAHLSSRRRRQLAIVLGLMIVSSFAEVVSLGMVVPFLGILISPEKAFQSTIVTHVAEALGYNKPEDLVLPITIIFAVIAALAGAIRLVQLWATTRLTFAAGSDLSTDAYRRTLYQTYQVHLSRNSSSVVSGVIDKVNHVVFWVLQPILTLISSLILFVSMILALMFISPFVALISMAGFGSAYILITWVARRTLRRNGQLIAREQTQVIKAVQEGIGGIRDVLLDGTQPFYCEIYKKAEYPLRRAYGNNIFISGSPRFVMESMGMILIAGLAYGLSRQVGGISAALPVLGALALAAQRILPALQQTYSSWTGIIGGHAILAEVIAMLNQEIPQELLLPTPEPLPFHDNIRFEKVRFQYSPEGQWVLNGLDLEIKKGTRVGFVGSSGSGKSTTFDLLMGLLKPTEGEIRVDGQLIQGEQRRAWQRTIAHVPQSIYLADASIAENIAFGVPLHAIDMQRVRQAAQQAQIADFIESKPEGYNAFGGERGIRLSGGQRQRIGIARALYKQASVIVFDEATSALDSETERGVMEAIENLSRDLTLILIAHRTTTLKGCDKIVELQNGRAKAKDL